MKLEVQRELLPGVHGVITINRPVAVAESIDPQGLGRNVLPPMSLHLNQKELARRWRMSPRTLERWRWLREGPTYLKIGGKVIYKLAEIETFEAARIRAPSPGKERNA